MGNVQTAQTLAGERKPVPLGVHACAGCGPSNVYLDCNPDENPENPDCLDRNCADSAPGKCRGLLQTTVERIRELQKRVKTIAAKIKTQEALIEISKKQEEDAQTQLAEAKKSKNSSLAEERYLRKIEEAKQMREELQDSLRRSKQEEVENIAKLRKGRSELAADASNASNARTDIAAGGVSKMQPLMFGDKYGPAAAAAAAAAASALGVAGGDFTLPTEKTWSWTAPNQTIRAAISNLLYWKPQFAWYFGGARQKVIVNAYRSAAGRVYRERAVVEIAQHPIFRRATKLVLTIVVSGSATTPAYSASAREEYVFPTPPGFVRIGRHELGSFENMDKLAIFLRTRNVDFL
jgi:hypothetical protein